MSIVGTLWAEKALLASGWQAEVRISIGGDGRITAIETGVKSKRGDLDLGSRALLPAPANLHSHAFQRAMAGLAEYRGTGEDDFWSWRDLMYRFVARLDPDDVEAIAAGVQMEMLEAGYAACGEFHYLHHKPDGSSYDNAAEMSARIAAAAHATGIGLTLLPVYYQRGGLDGRPLAGGQMRFGCSRDRFETLMSSAQMAVSDLAPDCNVGVAPHSLRAVPAEDLNWLHTLVPGQPVHIHIAEQTAEVDHIEAGYGARPVRWLLDNIAVDERWCLVHATHMQADEVKAFAASGAVAGLCPVTESNLGDGIFAGAEFLAQGGYVGIGSDSNVRICLAEELRTLEYSQRLRDQRRVVLTQDGLSVGRTLFSAVCRGGARATNRGSGEIAAGELADLVTLDRTSVHTAGLDGDFLLDGWIFAGDDRLVCDVFCAGRHMVREGNHIHRDRINAKFRQTLKRLRAEL